MRQCEDQCFNFWSWKPIRWFTQSSGKTVVNPRLESTVFTPHLLHLFFTMTVGEMWVGPTYRGSWPSNWGIWSKLGGYELPRKVESRRMKETKEGFRVGMGGEKWEFPAISMNKDITVIWILDLQGNQEGEQNLWWAAIRLQLLLTVSTEEQHRIAGPR